jgi:catechol 2,3-dioxygenase-like lactoylglutathione lyase family enzyme
VNEARLSGVFAVKLPVSDLARARAWYEPLFDLRPQHEFADDDGVVRGIAYEVPGLGDTGLALRERPDVAGMSGFDPVIFAIEGPAAVTAWTHRFTDAGVAHAVRQGTIGSVVVFHDPDGLEIHLYSREHAIGAGTPGVGRRAVA